MCRMLKNIGSASSAQRWHRSVTLTVVRCAPHPSPSLTIANHHYRSLSLCFLHAPAPSPSNISPHSSLHFLIRRTDLNIRATRLMSARLPPKKRSPILNSSTPSPNSALRASTPQKMFKLTSPGSKSSKRPSKSGTRFSTRRNFLQTQLTSSNSSTFLMARATCPSSARRSSNSAPPCSSSSTHFSSSAPRGPTPQYISSTSVPQAPYS